MPGIGCVSEADLRALCLGELPERVSRQVADHLESCDVCESVIRRFDELTDPFLCSLRRAVGVEDESATKDLQGDTTVDPSACRMPSRQIAGYEMLGELGRGGMSVVYKARQRRTSRLVALKMILAGAHSGAERRARLLAEANAIARLQHPHIVQIYEAGECDGQLYLALEYVDGGNLARLLDGNPQDPYVTAALLEKLALSDLSGGFRRDKAHSYPGTTGQDPRRGRYRWRSSAIRCRPCRAGNL